MTTLVISHPTPTIHLYFFGVVPSEHAMRRRRHVIDSIGESQKHFKMLAFIAIPQLTFYYKGGIPRASSVWSAIQ